MKFSEFYESIKEPNFDHLSSMGNQIDTLFGGEAQEVWNHFAPKLYRDGGLPIEEIDSALLNVDKGICVTLKNACEKYIGKSVAIKNVFDNLTTWLNDGRINTMESYEDDPEKKRLYDIYLKARAELNEVLTGGDKELRGFLGPGITHRWDAPGNLLISFYISSMKNAHPEIVKDYNWQEVLERHGFWDINVGSYSTRAGSKLVQAVLEK